MRPPAKAAETSAGEQESESAPELVSARAEAAQTQALSAPPPPPPPPPPPGAPARRAPTEPADALAGQGAPERAPELVSPYIQAGEAQPMPVPPRPPPPPPPLAGRPRLQPLVAEPQPSAGAGVPEALREAAPPTTQAAKPPPPLSGRPSARIERELVGPGEGSVRATAEDRTPLPAEVAGGAWAAASEAAVTRAQRSALPELNMDAPNGTFASSDADARAPPARQAAAASPPPPQPQPLTAKPVAAALPQRQAPSRFGPPERAALRAERAQAAAAAPGPGAPFVVMASAERAQPGKFPQAPAPPPLLERPAPPAPPARPRRERMGPRWPTDRQALGRRQRRAPAPDQSLQQLLAPGGEGPSEGGADLQVCVRVGPASGATWACPPRLLGMDLFLKPKKKKTERCWRRAAPRRT